MGHDGPSGTIAGGEPADPGTTDGVDRGKRPHEVSILMTIGLGRCRGASPRPKTSTTSMRAPQHGQGRG